MEQEYENIPEGYERRRPVRRWGTDYTEVKGRTSRGETYMWVEELQPTETGTVVCWYFDGFEVPAADPAEGDQVIGLVKPIITYWTEGRMLGGRFLKTVEGSRRSYRTNDVDMAYFCLAQGDDNAAYILNGFWRNKKQMDQQPSHEFNFTEMRMVEIPESRYNTDEPGPGTYSTHALIPLTAGSDA